MHNLLFYACKRQLPEYEHEAAKFPAGLACRLAYHEHPSYVPLLLRAYKLWRELQAESGQVGVS